MKMVGSILTTKASKELDEQVKKELELEVTEEKSVATLKEEQNERDNRVANDDNNKSGGKNRP